MAKCKCGCGEETKINPRTKVPNKYIRGHGFRGKTLSKEHKQKLSEANIGKKFSKEHKQRISEANTGKKHSEESKKKMSESSKGKKHTKETKKKIGKATKGKVSSMKGKKHSEETKKKIGEKSKGRSGAMLGKRHSEESKRKMSNSLKGHKRTEKWCRRLSESKTGEKNPAWNGGTSFLPYCSMFNKPLKKEIRDRDKHTCQLCGIEENDRLLSIHHIHYDKENCYPDLVALCNSCNAKVNINRDYWQMYFMRQLIYRKIPTVMFNMESELGISGYENNRI